MSLSEPANSTRRSRKASQLNPRLDKTLSSYALAAGATGVGLLALAQPAAGKIAYTPAHQRIGKHTFLDLNGDGINDFQLSNTVSSICYGSHCGAPSHRTQAIDFYDRLNIYGVGAGNQAMGGAGYVSQLAAGVSVGSNGPFQGAKLLGGQDGVDGTVTFQFGPWLTGGGTHQGYVGLKFTINGAVHFGWARVKLQANGDQIRPVLITGYAYETTPNTPIITGKTSGPNNAGFVPQPGAASSVSLGLLAQGAPTLSVWRREEDERPIEGREA